MKNGKWDLRIRRAGELAAVHPFAAEGLRFYERLARFQKSLYFQIEAQCGRSKIPRAPGALRREFDPFLLLPRFAPFLSLIEQIAPTPLSRNSGNVLGRRVGIAGEPGTGGSSARMDVPATLCRISCGPHGVDDAKQHAVRLSALQRQAAGGGAAPGRRRREAFVDLLAMWNGVGVPADCVPRVRRRRRA